MFEQLKREPGQGPPTREAWNALLEHLEALRVTVGPGLMLARGPRGTLIKPAPARRHQISGKFHLDLTVQQLTATTIGDHNDPDGDHNHGDLLGLASPAVATYTLYWRFGVLVGQSDSAGLPPWDPDSGYYDAEEYPDGTDPAGDEFVWTLAVTEVQGIP